MTGERKLTVVPRTAEPASHLLDRIADVLNLPVSAFSKPLQRPGSVEAQRAELSRLLTLLSSQADLQRVLDFVSCLVSQAGDRTRSGSD